VLLVQVNELVRVGAEVGRVVRVGRALFDVECRGQVTTYRLADGRRNVKVRYGADSRVRTLAEAEVDDRRATADRTLRDHKISLDRSHGLTLEQIEALADLARTFTPED
jgi:hypothetical protein